MRSLNSSLDFLMTSHVTFANDINSLGLVFLIPEIKELDSVKIPSSLKSGDPGYTLPYI